MNHDFRNAKVGDVVWHVRFGWGKITWIDLDNRCPIVLEGVDSFTIDGRFQEDDVAPTLFIEPPACFNAKPKPCKFEKGQRVLVRNSPAHGWNRAYYAKEEDGLHYTYLFGKDEWASDGRTRDWSECRAWKEGEE